MMKVLVVEDEEMIRKGIVLTVDWASLDCTVVAEAANGEEGLAAAAQFQPDLIITDLKMPKMDGIEMLRQLRQAGSNAHVIILTAYDSFEYARSALRFRAVDYLLKPFHDGELEQSILTMKSRLSGKIDDTPEAFPGMRKGDRSRYVQQAMEYMGSHYPSPDLTVAEIAAHLELSEGHLSHLFRRETDYTVLTYLTRLRIHKAMIMLRTENRKIYEVAEAVGYRDIAYFSTTFKKIVGLTPSEYQDPAAHPGKESL